MYLLLAVFLRNGLQPHINSNVKILPPPVRWHVHDNCPSLVRWSAACSNGRREPTRAHRGCWDSTTCRSRDSVNSRISDSTISEYRHLSPGSRGQAQWPAAIPESCERWRPCPESDASALRQLLVFKCNKAILTWLRREWDRSPSGPQGATQSRARMCGRTMNPQLACRFLNPRLEGGATPARCLPESSDSTAATSVCVSRVAFGSLTWIPRSKSRESSTADERRKLSRLWPRLKLQMIRYSQPCG